LLLMVLAWARPCRGRDSLGRTGLLDDAVGSLERWHSMKLPRGHRRGNAAGESYTRAETTVSPRGNNLSFPRQTTKLVGVENKCPSRVGLALPDHASARNKKGLQPAE
jgi:hypothetical protein